MRLVFEAKIEFTFSRAEMDALRDRSRRTFKAGTQHARWAMAPNGFLHAAWTQHHPEVMVTLTRTRLVTLQEVLSQRFVSYPLNETEIALLERAQRALVLLAAGEDKLNREAKP